MCMDPSVCVCLHFILAFILHFRPQGIYSGLKGRTFKSKQSLLDCDALKARHVPLFWVHEKFTFCDTHFLTSDMTRLTQVHASCFTRSLHASAFAWLLLSCTFDWLTVGLAKVHEPQQEHLILIIICCVHHVWGILVNSCRDFRVRGVSRELSTFLTRRHACIIFQCCLYLQVDVWIFIRVLCSFQLCVNIVNERLRRYVSEMLFQQEQAECVLEGVPMETPCSSCNQPAVLDFFLQVLHTTGLDWCSPVWCYLTSEHWCCENRYQIYADIKMIVFWRMFTWSNFLLC